MDTRDDQPIEVPYERMRPETLQALIEEYVTRDGTDYGSRDASLEQKVEDVRRQLRRGDACVVFDPETESVNIISRRR